MGSAASTRNCTRKYPIEGSGIYGHNYGYRIRLLAAGVLVEPLDSSFPGKIRCGLVVALGSCIVVEAVNGARVDVTFVRDVGLLEFRFVCRPCHGEPSIERAMVHKNSRFDFGNIRQWGISAI